MGEHELLHSAYALYKKHHDPDVSPGADELYLTTYVERGLVDEISAHRSCTPSSPGRASNSLAARFREMAWNSAKRDLKTRYLEGYKQGFHYAGGFNMKRVDSVMETTSSRIGKAVDAVCYMQDVGIPESEITHRLLAVGPTRSELSRGEFYSPLNDVIAWGEYTRRGAEGRKTGGGKG